VVPHTHWDREWYAGFPFFRARLVEMLSALLTALEADSSLGHVLLDGQVAMVDDYLAVRPEDEQRLRSLVSAGRLSVGPWYVLMDEFLVSGETIVRNLQRGIARAACLGGHLPVGYLPDMFGHVAQMPQILRSAGLEHAVVWRGVPRAVDRSGFWWRAPDGSTVRAEYLPAGYSTGASLPLAPDALLRRLGALDAQLGPFALAGAPLLVMNGTDHEAPDAALGAALARLHEVQDDYEVSITSLAEYLRAAPTEGLPTWTGELRSSARANLLMGVVSNHVEVKAAAARAERSLERRAEPLGALWLPATDWPAGLVDRAWTAMLRNAAHDSICACSADEVVLAVLHRYAEAEVGAEAVVASVLHHLAGAFADASTVVVNPSPTTRAAVVELTWPGSTPPEGTQVLATLPAGTVERVGQGRDLARLLGELTDAGWLDDGAGTDASVSSSAERIELRLRCDPARATDRSLRPLGPVMAEASALAAAAAERTLVVSVERRAATRLLARVVVPGYGWSTLGGEDHPALPADARRGPWVRGPDLRPVSAGDNWLDNGALHLSVNPADGTFTLNGVAGLDRWVDGGDAGDTYNYAPPAEDRLVTRPEAVSVRTLEAGPLRGVLEVTRVFVWPARLEGQRRVGRSEVEVRTLLQLHAGDPLVRVVASWDNPVRDHRLRTVFPLPARAELSEAECAFGTVRRSLVAEGGPLEVGLPTFPARRFVSAGGLTVTHEGVCEYEVIDDGWSLALTLLRGTGVISRPVTATRPNAAGPPTPTPGAQLLGARRARYGIALGDVDPWRLAEAAWEPFEVLHSRGGGALGASGSHLGVSGAEVSSLRRVGSCVELRVFNPGDDPTLVEVPGRSGWLVDLTGRPLQPWSASFVLPGHGIATARLDPEGGPPSEA